MAGTARPWLSFSVSDKGDQVHPPPPPLPIGGVLGEGHGLINYVDSKAKCRHPKKFDIYMDFAAGVYLFIPHPPRFAFGMV